MSQTPQFVDVSQFQGTIDWQAYKAWSASADGISRVAMRSSYGVGYTDQHFATYRAGALAANIDHIFYYHFSYPQYNSKAEDEANWQAQTVGAIRAADVMVLDFEEGVPQATAAWALAWLTQQAQNYPRNPPALYASDAYIRQRLQDARLAHYPLWLANWQFSPDERPACPPPWTSYTYVQYTDKATNIPGVPGTVDANIFVGGKDTMSSSVPSGWKDDGTTLTAPNGVAVVDGFRQKVLSTANWDAGNVPLVPAFSVNPVQLHNPDLGAGTMQPFRDSVLWWTTGLGVVLETQNGSELWAAYQKIATLQSANPATPSLALALSTLTTVIAALQDVQKKLSSS